MEENKKKKRVKKKKYNLDYDVYILIVIIGFLACVWVLAEDYIYTVLNLY